jgi:hypothetical protein
LKDDTGTKVVHDKRLVRLGEAQFPWQPSILDSCPAAGAGPTVMARDGDVFRMALK